jgi:general secretion pathway protein K
MAKTCFEKFFGFQPVIRSYNKKKGSFLIFSLWVIIIISYLLLELSWQSRLGTRLTTYHEDELRFLEVAKSVATVISSRLEEKNRVITTNNLLLEAKNYIDDIYFEGAHVAISCEDESSRININHVSFEGLKKIFSDEIELAAAIHDWRDLDDNPTSGGGAEKDFSDYVGLSIKPRNGPLKSLDEMLLIRGMTPSIFNEIQPYVTVMTAGPININTASDKVLSKLGLPLSLVEKIGAYRRGDDGIENTEDDNVFPSIASLSSSLSAWKSLTIEEVNFLTNLIKESMLSVRSDNFRIHVTVQLEGKKNKRQIILVISTKPGTEIIKGWIEANDKF